MKYLNNLKKERDRERERERERERCKNLNIQYLFKLIYIQWINSYPKSKYEVNTLVSSFKSKKN